MPPTDLQLEQETTIAYNAAEDHALVWSTDSTFQRKMIKLGVQPIQVGKRSNGQESYWYRVPKTWIRIKPPVVQQLTDEQRRDRVERGRSLSAQNQSLKSSQFPIPPE